jgi:hypothetical protein
MDDPVARLTGALHDRYSIARITAGLERVGQFGGPAMTAPVRQQRGIALSRRPATREQGITMLRYSSPCDPQVRPLRLIAVAEALQAAGDRRGAEAAYGEFLGLRQRPTPRSSPGSLP